MKIIFEDNIKKSLLGEVMPGRLVADESGTIYIVVNDEYENIIKESNMVAVVRVWDGTLFKLSRDIEMTPCDFTEIRLKREMV